jgi:hypothetical protein
MNIPAQLTAIYGPSNPLFGRFDVFCFDNAPAVPRRYTVRAIAYSRFGGATSNEWHDKWTYLLEGDSSSSIHAAYEHLWQQVNTITSQDMKSKHRGNQGKEDVADE